MYGTTTPDYDTGAALWHQDYDTGRGLSVLPGTHRHGDALRADGGLVTLTIGLFTLGAHLDRNMSGGWASCSGSHRLSACSAMNVTVRQSEQPTLVLLFCFGFLVGLAMADDGLHHPGVAPAGPCPAVPSERESFSWARSNPFLLVAVLGAVAVQLAILYLPALQRLFATQALSPVPAGTRPGGLDRRLCRGWSWRSESSADSPEGPAGYRPNGPLASAPGSSRLVLGG